jgi:hypothetical protein
MRVARSLLVLAVLVVLTGTGRAEVPILISSTGGTGAPPEAGDEVTYRLVQWPTGSTRDGAGRMAGGQHPARSGPRRRP